MPQHAAALSEAPLILQHFGAEHQSSPAGPSLPLPLRPSLLSSFRSPHVFIWWIPLPRLTSDEAPSSRQGDVLNRGHLASGFHTPRIPLNCVTV